MEIKLFKNPSTDFDEFKKYLLNEMTIIIKNIDKDSLIFFILYYSGSTKYSNTTS